MTMTPSKNGTIILQQILGYVNPWLAVVGPGGNCTIAREVLDVYTGLLLTANRVSQANRCEAVVALLCFDFPRGQA